MTHPVQYFLAKNGVLHEPVAPFTSYASALDAAKILQSNHSTSTICVLQVLAVVKTEYIEKQIIEVYG